jgi:membrane protease YdiL (CAAX protease family)
MEQPTSAADTSVIPRGAVEIALVLLIVYLILPRLVFDVLDGTGFFRRLYGAEAVALAQPNDAVRQQQRLALGVLAGTGAAEVGLPLLRRLVLLRFNLWVTVLAFPLQAAAAPLLLYGLGRTRPDELGLTTRRLGRNLLLGAAGFVVLSPLVLGINYLVEKLYTSALGGVPQVHSLTLLAMHGPTAAEWALLILTGMVAAPVLEELIFRGLLQRYFVSVSWGGHAALALAFGAAAVVCWGQARSAGSPAAALLAAAPALFILALVPFYLAVLYRSRTPAGPAIFGTSALFAAIHSSVWPTPVALFALAVGLGLLAHRTRSLAGPMLLHSLFNGIACVWLLLRW